MIFSWRRGFVCSAEVAPKWNWLLHFVGQGQVARWGLGDQAVGPERTAGPQILLDGLHVESGFLGDYPGNQRLPDLAENFEDVVFSRPQPQGRLANETVLPQPFDRGLFGRWPAI